MSPRGSHYITPLCVGIISILIGSFYVGATGNLAEAMPLAIIGGFGFGIAAGVEICERRKNRP